MSTQRFHVWYLRRDEIPALVDLAYSARLAQVVNHVIFQNRGGEDIQRVQCERAVRALFDDPTAKCAIIKPEDSDEIVGFCIEKRCVNDAQVNSPSPEGPTKPAKRPRLDLRIVTGASEPELPDYPNFLQQPNSHTGTNLTNTHSEKDQDTVMSDDLNRSSPEATPKSFSGQYSALHYRNFFLSDPPSPDGHAMAVYKIAKENLSIIDQQMLGINYIGENMIEYLWVKPDYRFKGIGQKFVDDCIKDATSHALPLYICAEPTAAGFFRSCGFLDTMSFIVNLAQNAPDMSGYGEHRSIWMRWLPPVGRR
ncbi:uncharacterized protein N7506_002117 [Penicillium brevicompactum]|uniref:uncharacterized protein n=1 Tax=Penicillium brevicompactum TaxID=5074 RepID=UPI00254164E2|nr:uncharacterized protein N7506_002117 [Penicillium brevicompactum]KAJ5348864.1 hypothetical protein N7506_002117 [Penicillium brevicompactum]